MGGQGDLSDFFGPKVTCAMDMSANTRGRGPGKPRAAPPRPGHHAAGPGPWPGRADAGPGSYRAEADDGHPGFSWRAKCLKIRGETSPNEYQDADRSWGATFSAARQSPSPARLPPALATVAVRKTKQCQLRRRPISATGWVWRHDGPPPRIVPGLDRQSTTTPISPLNERAREPKFVSRVITSKDGDSGQGSRFWFRVSVNCSTLACRNDTLDRSHPQRP